MASEQTNIPGTVAWAEARADRAEAQRDAAQAALREREAEVASLREVLQGLYDACERQANAAGGDFGADIGPAAEKAEAVLTALSILSVVTALATPTPEDAA